jgi:chemotaxis protein methyltransferase CheR
MILLETLPSPETWRIDLVATDISENALTQARKGEFSQFEIQRGVPIQVLIKHFKQDGQSWKINDNIKRLVRFENFNLLEPMEKFGTFDIIFCRNVLIYFDEATKKKILQNMIKRIAPDGFLFLGGAETALGLCPELKIDSGCPGLYTIQHVGAAGAPSHPPILKAAGTV